MRINKQLLPVKAHYFFFMCAMGPILPQLSVYGKEMGISTVVMGMVTGILPFAFLIAKPLFGLLVDVYRNYRKTIFMLLIIIMTISYALMAFIPVSKTLSRTIIRGQLEHFYLDTCKVIDKNPDLNCTNFTKTTICNSECFIKPHSFRIAECTNPIYPKNLSYRLCLPKNKVSVGHLLNSSCDINCLEASRFDDGETYQDFSFWSFIILMSVGTIAFNVVNSISDAICFDVIGDTYDYGKQRVWGTIGFGTSALIGGYAVDYFSGYTVSYIPATIVLVFFSCLDLICCFKLKLPIIEAPKNIIKDIKELMNNRHVVTFMAYAIMVGVLDGFIIYFLFWYVEDLAANSDTMNVKLLEGLIVAAETLGGEVVFFSISGKILERFGHVNCFSICFVNYALRLGLISVAPSPWWILPIELVFQGPTYALTYTTVVQYANELSPAGATATMQGIAAGMDDGVGYAIGSISGGLLYKFAGGKNTFQVFSVIGVICSISHLIIHKTLLKEHEPPVTSNGAAYKSPEDAISEMDKNTPSVIERE